MKLYGLKNFRPLTILHMKQKITSFLNWTIHRLKHVIKSHVYYFTSWKYQYLTFIKVILFSLKMFFCSFFFFFFLRQKSLHSTDYPQCKKHWKRQRLVWGGRENTDKMWQRIWRQRQGRYSWMHEWNMVLCASVWE